MATGASTADVAILLVDARHGVRDADAAARAHRAAARHHALRPGGQQDGPGRLRPRASSTTICDDFAELAAGARRPRDSDERAATATTSSRTSDAHAVVRGAGAAARILETVEVERERAAGAFRMPVQLVVRPDHDVPRLRRADRVRHDPRSATRSPSGRPGVTAPVKRIVTLDGDLDEAFAPMSVTLVLDDEIDISRGDVLAGRRRCRSPTASRRTSCGWTSGRSIRAAMYLLKHNARTVTAEVDRGLDAEPDRHGRRSRRPGRCCSIRTRRTARPAASS